MQAIANKDKQCQTKTTEDKQRQTQQNKDTKARNNT